MTTMFEASLTDSPLWGRKLLATVVLVALASHVGADSSWQPLGMDLRIPARHPYLMLTPEELRSARERASNLGWAKVSLERVGDARSLLGQQWEKLPAKGDRKHHEIVNRLLRAALAYAFGGEAQYAEWVRDALLAYADLYPTLPLTNRRCRLFSQSSLYEATWLQPAVLAYDLVADSGVFSEEQKRHVERDLLRRAVECFRIEDFDSDPRIGDLHYRCYNFQAWHLSVVGLVGLTLRDPSLVEYAVNSPYGFQHLLAHDVRDDGLFWERSVGYHHFVLQALMPFLEAMRHCGADLYHLRVPPERPVDEKGHWVAPGGEQPRSLAMMFVAPFYLMFPDGSYPALGDSDRGPRSATGIHLVAHQQYRLPQLAWLLQRDRPLPAPQSGKGRVGFLHYYRYHCEYAEVRLNGRPITWERVDSTLSVHGDRILADDGGGRQQDRYILNGADLEDFTLEWTARRLRPLDRDDRAWVVFRVDAADPAERTSFPFHSHMPELGRAYHFRLVVRGTSSRLFRDGQLVTDKPAVYHRSLPWQWLVHSVDYETEAASAWQEGKFANNGEFRNGCSLFPSSGVAVLRQRSGDFTDDQDATAVALSYGPYGGGHGHPDKLGIVLYARRRQWITHFGSMPYGSHWKEEWTAQTISHNTVVVDETSQLPTGKRNVMWPVDGPGRWIVGKLVEFDARRKRVTASADSVYPGVKLRRSVQLMDNCVVDHFIAAADSEHQFDYALHIDAEPAAPADGWSAASGPLGKACGYQYVQQEHRCLANRVTPVGFRVEGDRLRLWVVADTNRRVEMILAHGMGRTPDSRAPMLVLRRRGPRAEFTVVMEPMDARQPLLDVQPVAGGVSLVRRSGTVRVSTGP